MGFPGVPNMTLKDAVGQHLQEEYDLKGMIHSEIMNSALPHVKTEKVLEMMHELNDSLQRCVDDLKVLIEESEVMKKRIKKKKNCPFLNKQEKLRYTKMILLKKQAIVMCCTFLMKLIPECLTVNCKLFIQHRNVYRRSRKFLGK